MPYGGNSQFYRPSCCGRPNALSPEALWPPEIVHQVIHNTSGNSFDWGPQRHETVV